jgi:hypothetical protein
MVAVATYLVDYENKSQKGDDNGLAGIEDLRDADKVVVFLGKRSVVPAAVLDAAVNKSRAQVVFEKCKRSAKNYLDFQLSSYLGFVLGSTNETQVCIVSSDKGYAAVVDLWALKRPDAQVTTGASIKLAAAPAPAPAPVAEKPAKAAKAAKEPKPKPAKEAKPKPAKEPKPAKAKSQPASQPQPRSQPQLPAPVQPQSLPEQVQKINKLDPPETIRKLVRPVYKQEGIESGTIGQLYDAFRASRDEYAFITHLRDLYDDQRLARIQGPLLAAFAKYLPMR